MELLGIVVILILFIKNNNKSKKIATMQEQCDKWYKGIKQNEQWVSQEKAVITNQKTELERQRQDVQNKARELAFLRSATMSDLPIVGDILAEIDKKRSECVEECLRTKKRPAPAAADEVKRIASLKKELVKEVAILKYKNKYYEHMFPFIVDLEDEPLSGATIENRYNPEWKKEDNAGFWLTTDEYNNLPTARKYQLALDRYKRRRKSNAEIGRDYERFVGYEYETAGYDVIYNGINKGLEDFGIDLICYPKNKVGKILLVQCKCWSHNKTIHEKHINQLFGTSMQHYLENFYSNGEANDSWQTKIQPVFVTTTVLSDTAKKFASYLGVYVVERYQLGDYPIIKCNINLGTKEKIYHLPFDQQYDKTQIKNSGECYVATVSEAESKGFRRAMRWYG